MTQDSQKCKVIGMNLPRLDAIDKLTGSGLFVADIKLPHMLDVAVVRSQYPHAVIENVDISQANREGVYAVVTGKGGWSSSSESHDFMANSEEHLFGSCLVDQPPMAREKVRYIGEPVAAVVAHSPEIASQAATAIKVQYRPLPHVLDPRQAILPTAPLLHEHLGNYQVAPGFKPQAASNVYHHYTLLKGDVARGLREASHVFTHEFVYPHISHAQLEPHGCIAHWERNGELTIYTSAQSPWYVRSIIAAAFGISHSSVKVIVPYVGGGFGGKSDVTIEPLVTYIASFVPGYPIRYVLTREEMFVGTVLGRGCIGKVTTGVSQDAKITALEIKLLFQGGAYGDCSINIVTASGHNSSGPYEIDNIRVDSLGVYTNTPYIGAFRGYGHPEVHWIMDRNLEIIAYKLSVDPYRFKTDHLLKPGSKNALNQIIQEHDGRLRDCVDFVYRAVSGIPCSRDGDKLIGYGFTPIMKSPVIPNNAASCAMLRFNEDTSVSISISSIDMGQGSNTVLSQIAAEALEMPVEKIRICRTVSTEYTPYEWQTVASRTTWTVGNAILKAVSRAIATLKEIASEVLHKEVQMLEYDGRRVYVKDDPCTSVHLEKLVMGYVDSKGKVVGGPIMAQGYYIPPGLTSPDAQTGQGNLASEWTFGCQGVVVEIDRHTGRIDVRKMVTALDVGRVINPLLARGQVVGAMVQALGAAMSEKVIYDSQGRIRNASLTDYKIPSPEEFADAEIVVQFFETPFPKGPFGARCLGEHGTVGMASALGNAVFMATGIEFHELPITSEKIWRQLRQKEGVSCSESSSI